MNENDPQRIQPPQQNTQFAQHPAKTKGKGIGIAAMVLGIIAAALSFIPILNVLAVPLVIVGLILGIASIVMTRNGQGPKGFGIAGIVCSAVALIIVIAMYSTAAAVSDTLDSSGNLPDEIGNTAIEKEETEPKESDESAVNTNTENDVPTEYKSALKKAQSYSDTMHMSKAGIYDQLTSEYGESFTAEAAQYGIDNVNADWNTNALKKAESYQNTMAMSPSAIYDQLISEYGEKFTPEEAQYAIDNLK